MVIGLLGRKLGMTRVYDDKGNINTVTVIDVGGNVPLQRKTVEKDGYNALQVGFADQKESRITSPMMGHFRKHNSGGKRFVREFRLKDDVQLDENAGVPITQFQLGDYVDVIGQSKGKGFMGVMRKHNYHGQGAAHGSKTHRRNGAIGCRSTPGRIFKNQGMPGHMGDERVTVQNLVVLQVRENENVLLVKGAIPGAKGSYVVVRPAKKKNKSEKKAATK